MKVVLINTSERSGGAAIACNRLMEALQKEGLQVSLLVRNKATTNPHVFTVNTSYFKRKINFARFVWERLIIYINNKFNKKNLFAVSLANIGTNISQHPAIRDADIIHIHWINQGFLSLKNIHQLINTNKPIVWTMHDMWAYTAICHHSRECNKYTTQCQQCPFLNSTKQNDLSAKYFKKKKKLYTAAPICFVGCSQWVTNGAHKSQLLLGQHKILSIPNPINISQYKPTNKQQAKLHFNFFTNKKLILFGAPKVTDKRKGIDYLIDACNILANISPDLKNEIEIITFGQNTDAIKQQLPFTVHSMNYISDIDEMVTLYNCADVYVTPSLEENLPNTIMEAMACGLPCVGFNVGGIPEMINHRENGYVACYKSANDLANGIHWVLFTSNYNLLSQNAQQKVRTSYAEHIVAQKYISVYKECMQKNQTIV